MYLDQELTLMSADLIYPSSLNSSCLDNRNIKVSLYVSFLRKSLFQEGIKNRLLNDNDHNDSI